MRLEGFLKVAEGASALSAGGGRLLLLLTLPVVVGQVLLAMGRVRGLAVPVNSLPDVIV